MVKEAPTVLSEDELKTLARTDYQEVENLQNEVATLELALSQNEQFKQFMKLKKDFEEKSRQFNKNIEAKMIENNIKSIKVDDVASFTIVDGKKWTYDKDVLPKKFMIKSVDTTAINNHYKLTGKLPKGASYVPNQYIKVTPVKEEK